jgi:hypothetical protein
MALNKVIADFFARGLEAGAILPGGDLLEIGESVVVAYNTPLDLIASVEPHIPPSRAAEAKRRAEASGHNKSLYQQTFGPARAFYDAVFEPRVYLAAEITPKPRRLCIDMNVNPVVRQQFDYVINNGSSEHIFDQARTYKFIHDATRVGGLMFHWTPCLGYENHGLFNAQPGFFFDLSQANGYDIVRVDLIGHNAFCALESGDDYRRAVLDKSALRQSMVCAILRKTSDSAFNPPIQGVYQGADATAYELAKVPRRYVVDGRHNLALGRPSSQSSTSQYSYDGDPLVDAAGGNNGIVAGYYSFHTDLEVNPWWMVDLGSDMPVREVVVYNVLSAAGHIAGRSNHIRLHLSPDGVSWLTAYARTDDFPFGGADGHPLRVRLHGQTARYVRLDLPGRTVLHLDEVEVY